VSRGLILYGHDNPMAFLWDDIATRWGKPNRLMVSALHSMGIASIDVLIEWLRLKTVKDGRDYMKSIAKWNGGIGNGFIDWALRQAHPDYDSKVIEEKRLKELADLERRKAMLVAELSKVDAKISGLTR